MNLAYFRNSRFDQKVTVANLKSYAKEMGLEVIGESTLPSKNGTILHVCQPTWMGNLIAADENLIGLLPCAVVVIERNNEVMVGVGSPAVLRGVSQNPAIAALAEDADKKLRTIIHKAAGVEALKPKSVTVYSTTTCPYCKMESAWLDEHKVAHTVVNVDQDQKQAEEMVRKTGQMGVPVTAIAYDNGQEEYIVGFDKGQLSQILQV